MATYKDLSLLNVNGGKLDKPCTANCYVIHSEGYYMFPTVYGNSILKGEINDKAYTSIFGTTAFWNYNNVQISQPYIEDDTSFTISSVEVLYRDEADFKISDLHLDYEELPEIGYIVQYVHFKIDSIPENGGNIIIAVKDPGGKVMWSWHLWGYKATIGTKPYESVNFMEVPLGFVKDASSAYRGTPMLYQYGRKDPLLRESSVFSATELTPAEGSPVEYKLAGYYNGRYVSQYSNMIQTPRSVMCYDEGNGSYGANYFAYHGAVHSACCVFDDAWNVGRTDKDACSDTPTVKTINDPSPYGFCVPSGGQIKNFCTDLRNTANFDTDYTIYTYKGVHVGAWQKNGMYVPFVRLVNPYYLINDNKTGLGWEDSSGVNCFNFVMPSSDITSCNSVSDTYKLVLTEGWSTFIWGFRQGIPTLGATALAGWEPYHWSDWTTIYINTLTVGTTGPVFSVLDNSSIGSVTIDVTATPEGYGTALIDSKVTSKTVDAGTSVFVSAKPTDGYDFLSWSDGGTKTHKVSVDSDMTLTATFGVATYTVTVESGDTTQGSVNVDGSGTTKSVTSGTTVTINALPNAGYIFDSWSDGGAKSHTITVTEDITITATFKVKPVVVYTDLSMFDAFGTALTSPSTANCYVIRGAGSYKFPAVYGNSILCGMVNSPAYTPIDSQSSASFFNYNTVRISSPIIEKDTNFDINSVSVVYCDSSDYVISEMETGEETLPGFGESVRYVKFTVDSIPECGGNAVIAVKDESGKVMWSWHIWAYPFELKSKLWNDTMNILNVPLGYVKVSTSSHRGTPMLYQAGRKDPLFRESTPLSCTEHTPAIGGNLTVGTQWDTSAGAHRNPHSFGLGQNYSGWSNSWVYLNGQIYESWNYTASGSTHKTINDPCPFGFCVPDPDSLYWFGSKIKSTANYDDEDGSRYGAWQDNGVYIPFAPVGDFSDNTSPMTIKHNMTTFGGDPGLYTSTSGIWSTDYVKGIANTEYSESAPIRWAQMVIPVGDSNANTPTITVEASPESGGTVTIDGASVTTKTVLAGSSVTILAVPSMGYTFKEWSDGGTQSHSVTVNSNVTITATFEELTPAPTTSDVKRSVSKPRSYGALVCPGSDSNATDTKDGSTPIPTGAHTDLSLMDGDGNTLTVPTTSNCYVIRKSGKYKFPLIYGNGVTKGAFNTAAFTPVSTGTKFPNTDNVQISDARIETDLGRSASYALVSFNDSPSFGINGIRLTKENLGSLGEVTFVNFIVSNVPELGANAGIAVYDASGIVMWSWHLWGYPHNFETVPYTNTRSTSYAWMGVPLGCVKDDADSNHCTGMTYQFGRKDPIARQTRQMSGTTQPIYDGSTATCSSSNYKLSDGIRNPRLMCIGTATWYGWCSDNPVDSWNVGNASTDSTDGPVIKTIYDPCPTGYCVPPDGAICDWGNATEHTVAEDGTGWIINGGLYVPYNLYCAGNFVWQGNDTGQAINIISSTPYSGDSVVTTIADRYRGYVHATYATSLNPCQFDGQNIMPVVDTKFNNTAHTVKVNMTPDGAATVTGTGNYTPGEMVTVTLTPNAGYEFVKWRDGETNPTRTFMMSIYDVTLIAILKVHIPSTYTITTVASPSDGGTITGGGTYIEGTEVTLTATPASGYVFKEWNDGDTNATRTITVTGDATYTATFESATKQYTITTAVTPESTGTVTGGGTYNEGTEVTLTATPASGYVFKEWNDGNTDAARTITVTEDATYTATFAHQYTISTVASPTEGGTVTGGGTYYEGTEVTLTATPASGYKFLQWDDGDTSATRTITVTEDATYTASFTLDITCTTTPLKFSSASTQKVSLVKDGTGSFIADRKLYYSKNGTDWYYWGPGRESKTSELTFGGDDGDLYICGYNPYAFSVDSTKYYRINFGTNSKVAVSGNVMSLIDYSNEVTTIPYQYCFCNLFYHATVITSTPTLPATTLKDYCYLGMFGWCTSLTTTPALPSTTLASYCYDAMFANCTALTSITGLSATSIPTGAYFGMFKGCTALTTAPELPATGLATSCYDSMFYECTSLVNTPVLPATTTASGCYTRMFYGCTALTTAPTISATTIAGNCYEGMFQNCTSLVTPPTLPVMTLASNCYREMFSGCTKLVNAPALPATTLGAACYSYMFNGCSALTTTPTLPATTLVNNCYEGMFNDCIALVNVTTLPATVLAESCCSSMFKGCTAITTAPELPATTLAKYCYTSMFYGCTALTTPPSTIPATILADYCCNSMFYGCTALTTAPELPATTTTLDCYESMFMNCTSLVSAPELPATTALTRCYKEMFKGCISLVNAPALPATTLYMSCYNGMFYGCTALTTAPELPATTLANNCYGGMFKNCTALTTAPELPAPTLVETCYSAMFQGCSSLSFIRCLASTITATYATHNWVNGVAASGTFVQESGVTWSSGDSGIPYGWTSKSIYTITTEVTPTDSGTVTGGGAYTEGTEVTLTATPASGYTFTQWNDGDTNATRTITVTGDATYTATFTTAALYSVDVTVTPSDKGEVTGTGTYAAGSEVTLTAENTQYNFGYAFHSWDDGTRTNPLTFTMPANNVTRTAVYKLMRQVYVYVDPTWPETYGTTTGNGLYLPGDTVTMTATPNTGHSFSKWSDGVTTSTRYYTVTDDSPSIVEFTAIFV